MSYRRLLLLFVALLIACKPAAGPLRRAAVPQVRATVVTLRTATQPGARSTTALLVIAGNLARSTDEHDTWRLYDTRARRVTFVDDIAHTIRHVPFDELVKRHQAAVRNPLPAHYPKATLRRTGRTATLQGSTAAEWLIEVGAYRRQLWIAEHPAIPAELFAMSYLSGVTANPLAPVMRAVDEQLLTIRGFPLLDHAELPYDRKKLVVDRSVVSIARRDVPQKLLELPRGYLDLSAKPAPKK